MTTVVGISLPFFPMRPSTGRKITIASVDEIFRDSQNGQWLAQKKLNGDRAVLAVKDGKVTIINRNGSAYKHTVKNTADFLKLPDGTLLDGEVLKMAYYPFEALAINNVSLLGQGPHEREKAAIELATFLRHEWMFTRPTLEWMRGLKANLPLWEGLVLKRTNSPYIMLGSEGQESPAWNKVKW